MTTLDTALVGPRVTLISLAQAGTIHLAENATITG